MDCNGSHNLNLLALQQAGQGNAVQALVYQDDQSLADPTITMQPLELPAAIMFYQCAREGSKAFASLPMVR